MTPDKLPPETRFADIEAHAQELVAMFEVALRQHPVFSLRLNDGGILEVQSFAQALIPNDIQENATRIAANWAEVLGKSKQSLPYMYQFKIQGYVFAALQAAWRKVVKVKLPVPDFLAQEV